MTYRFAFGRPPTVAANGMVATSQPLATRAGLRALERGGNAADAALAAAAVLAVTEPTGNGIGGDNFAIVWKDGRAEGLDSAGPAPADGRSAEPVSRSTGRARSPCPARSPAGPRSPSATAGSGLDACLADAIDAAESGFAVTPLTAAAWGARAARREEYLPRAERGGDRPPARARRDAAAHRDRRAVGASTRATSRARSRR